MPNQPEKDKPEAPTNNNQHKKDSLKGLKALHDEKAAPTPKQSDEDITKLVQTTSQRLKEVKPPHITKDPRSKAHIAKETHKLYQEAIGTNFSKHKQKVLKQQFIDNITLYPDALAKLNHDFKAVNLPPVTGEGLSTLAQLYEIFPEKLNLYSFPKDPVEREQHKEKLKKLSNVLKPFDISLSQFERYRDELTASFNREHPNFQKMSPTAEHEVKKTKSGKLAGIFGCFKAPEEPTSQEPKDDNPRLDNDFLP